MGSFKKDKDGNRTFRCKHCNMQFEDKARLKRQDRNVGVFGKKMAEIGKVKYKTMTIFLAYSV